MNGFVQTERLSKSIFFNRLRPGMKVYVLDKARKDIPADADLTKVGRIGTIIKVPEYPR